MERQATNWNPFARGVIRRIINPVLTQHPNILTTFSNLYLTSAQSESIDNIYGGVLFYIECIKNRIR
jgi:hypothetical protein